MSLKKPEGKPVKGYKEIVQDAFNRGAIDKETLNSGLKKKSLRKYYKRK